MTPWSDAIAAAGGVIDKNNVNVKAKGAECIAWPMEEGRLRHRASVHGSKLWARQGFGVRIF
jgi:hypothetical protein